MMITSHFQLSRFGFMYGEDIEVLNAVAIPTGKIIDVYGEIEDNHDGKTGLSTTEQSKLFLLGFTITVVLIVAMVLYLHLRLRHQYSLYEKDKVQMSAGRKELHNILDKIVTPTNVIPSPSPQQRHSTISKGNIEENSLLRCENAED